MLTFSFKVLYTFFANFANNNKPFSLRRGILITLASGLILDFEQRRVSLDFVSLTTRKNISMRRSLQNWLHQQSPQAGSLQTYAAEYF